MNFLLTLWYKYKDWRYERKCIKYFGAKPERIIVSAEAYDELVRRINEPPQYNENIAKLLQKKAPWDE